jgi:hypothetical protein
MTLRLTLYRALALAAALLLALLLLARAASASYDPIGSGTAKLTLDKGFAKLLKQNGVRLKARKGAQVKGSVVTLTAAGGKADPTIKKAEIDLGGELIFAGASKAVPLTKITLKTQHTPVIARVGGGQLKLLSASRVSLDRDGFGDRLRATKLKLTAKFAQRLNKRLQLDVFAAGQLLGTLDASAQPSTLAVLPGGAATVAIDPAFAAKLKAFSTSLNPIAPAELMPGPVLVLPISVEGTIAPDGRSGTLRTAGSVEFLRLGAGQVFWPATWLDLATGIASAELDAEPAATYGGKQGRVPILDFPLAGALIASDPAARTITFSGAPVTLQAASAELFNRAFAEGKAQFSPGERLGTLSFTAQTQ